MQWMKFGIMPEPGHEVCDFCSSPFVYAAYAAEDFITPIDSDWITESKGAWSACQPCSELVDQERWDDLLKRSVEAFAAKYGVPFHMIGPLKEQISKIHEGFRKHLRKSA
jgi:hypothetical protein